MARPMQPSNAPKWEITSAEQTPGIGAMLRLGARAVPLSEVRGFVGSADREADKKPAFMTMAVFGIAAVLVLLGVMDIGWRLRFLAAAILFGGIALSALHDMAWMTTSGLYRVEVLTASGETIKFATVDQAEQQALMAALDRHIVRNRAANDELMADDALPAGLARA